MTLTLPTIAPTYFGLTNQAFNLAPVLRDGGTQVVQTSVVVPASTVITTFIGICPFRAGATLLYKGNELYIPDWDTGTDVTWDFGYVYYDSDTGTSDPDAFINDSTVGQAAGFASANLIAGYQFRAAGDGWFGITTAGGSTTTQVTVLSELLLSYSSSPVYS
jgi:hypothetical protein